MSVYTIAEASLHFDILVQQTHPSFSMSTTTTSYDESPTKSGESIFMWESVIQTISRFSRLFRTGRSDEDPPIWSSWDWEHGRLWSRKSVTFTSREGIEAEGVMGCWLEIDGATGTLLADVGAVLRYGHPFNPSGKEESEPRLLLRFGLDEGTPICFSYLGLDRKHELSTLTPRNPWSMKWEHAKQLMKIHLAGRKSDQGFVERYGIKVASDATLESLAEDAAEHVSQKAWTEMGSF